MHPSTFSRPHHQKPWIEPSRQAPSSNQNSSQRTHWPSPSRRTIPPGSSRLDDLAHPDITIVVCDVPVPCGAATQRLFDANALFVVPASLERDVRAVLTKVIQDEADAGIVYRTDITAAGDAVHGIDISSESNVINSYPIAVTATADDSSRDLATQFVDFVLSDDGQSILRSWGFGTP